MKKLALLTLSIFFIAVSCKKEAKKEEATPKFSVIPETITVNWTGYKTSDKVAVKGKFEKVEISNSKEAATAIEAINGTEFSLPVSSLASGDATRDTKLKTLFFAVMDATTSLTGTVNLEAEGKGTVNLKMNGVTKAIPITYVVSDQIVELHGTLDIVNDFKANAALESIHKACETLHTGADGVSKTWREVAIDAAIYLKKK